MTDLKIHIGKQINVLLIIKVNWFISENASMAVRMPNLLLKFGHSEKEPEKHTKFEKKST